MLQSSALALESLPCLEAAGVECDLPLPFPDDFFFLDLDLLGIVDLQSGGL